MTTRSTGLTFKRKGNYNGLVTKLGHVIPTVYQWLRDPNIDFDLSFASNQTSNNNLFRLFYETIAYFTIQ